MAAEEVKEIPDCEQQFMEQCLTTSIETDAQSEKLSVWQQAPIVNPLRTRNILRAYKALENIPPNNFKPKAASIILAVLNDPEQRFSDYEIQCIVTSNVLNLYYIGEFAPNERIWPPALPELSRQWVIESMAEKQNLVEKMRAVIDLMCLPPPCKKKGGSKRRKSKKSKRRKSKRQSRR
jgi:hypothetical protein